MDKLISKFNQIENKYEKILNKIKFIEKDNLKSEQKKLFFEIIMNMNNVILRQRERFVIYYGLDCEKEKIQNCSPTTIRQAVGNVARKISRLPTKEIIILKEILEDYNK